MLLVADTIHWIVEKVKILYVVDKSQKFYESFFLNVADIQTSESPSSMDEASPWILHQ